MEYPLLLKTIFHANSFQKPCKNFAKGPYYSNLDHFLHCFSSYENLFVKKTFIFVMLSSIQGVALC